MSDTTDPNIVQANVAKPTDHLQFVAVVFLNMDSESFRMHKPKSNSVYIYFDPFGLQQGDLALVHNGAEFGVVRVMRTVDINDPMALARSNKSLLAPLHYDEEVIVACQKRINDHKAGEVDYEIQRNIDKVLGINGDGTPGAERRRRLGLPNPTTPTGDFN